MFKADKKPKAETKEEIAEENSLKFDFKKWVTETQLTEKTVHILLEQDLNVLEALIMLTEGDVKELHLTAGQQKLLIKGINVAKNSFQTNKEEEKERRRRKRKKKKKKKEEEEKVNLKEITTASLSKDKDLETILNKLQSTGGLEALLTGAPLSTGEANKVDIFGGLQELRVDSDPHVYLNRSKALPSGSSKVIGIR